MAFKQGKINFNNPLKPYPMDDLIYDEEYLCFFKEEFIGVATFTNDPCIGDCFTKMHVHKNVALKK